ncbi:MAG TPA: helix-turn-helix transcriptional regulator [Marinagarivorans sp.]
MSTVIFSVMAGAIVLAIVSSVHRPDPQHSRNVFLMGLLVLLLLHTLGELLIASGGYRFAPQLVGIELPLRMLMGPALYLYARSMMPTEQLRVWPTLGLALLGPLLIVIVMAPFFQLTADEKLALASPATRDPDLFRLTLIICGATSVIFVAVTLCYLMAALRLQARHRQRVMEQYANIETRSLDWLRFMLVVWGGVWLLYILDNVLWVLNIRPPGLDISIAVLYALAVILFAHLALHQSPAKLETIQRSGPKAPITSESKAPPVTDRISSLAPERMQRIALKLTHAMENDRLFTNNELSLRHLADATNTSANHLSETFSQYLKTNFFKFVNEYRVAEAKQRLMTTDSTVTTIAYEVGYNSRSTFNAAFKKETGLTPTGFRNYAKGVDREERLS